MTRIFHFLLSMILLSACTPTTDVSRTFAVTQNLSPIATSSETPGPTTASSPTPSQSLPTPALNSEQLATSIGMPEDCGLQFPVSFQEKGFWRFAGIAPVDGLLRDFNLQVGDLLFAYVYRINYVNAAGLADFVYVPALTFNTVKRQTVIGANMVNNDDMALAVPARKQQGIDFVNKYFQVSMYQPMSYLYFAYAESPDIRTSLSAGFFNDAIMTLYSSETIEQFMATGDSSLLPHRLLVIYQNSTSDAYCRGE